MHNLTSFVVEGHAASLGSIESKTAGCVLETKESLQLSISHHTQP